MWSTTAPRRRAANSLQAFKPSGSARSLLGSDHAPKRSASSRPLVASANALGVVAKPSWAHLAPVARAHRVAPPLVSGSSGRAIVVAVARPCESSSPFFSHQRGIRPYEIKLALSMPSSPGPADFARERKGPGARVHSEDLRDLGELHCGRLLLLRQHPVLEWHQPGDLGKLDLARRLDERSDAQRDRERGDRIVEAPVERPPALRRIGRTRRTYLLETARAEQAPVGDRGQGPSGIVTSSATRSALSSGWKNAALHGHQL